MSTESVRGCPSYFKLLIALSSRRPPVHDKDFGLKRRALKRSATKNDYATKTGSPPTQPFQKFPSLVHRADDIRSPDALGFLLLRRAQGWGAGDVAVQIHLRIEELFQRTHLRALLGDVFLQLADPDLCGNDCGRGNRGRTADGDATHDLRATGVSCFAAALEIPGDSFVHLLVGGFLYRSEFVGGPVLHRLGRSATVPGRAESRG